MTTAGQLEGYLSLTSPSGHCVELFNSCRTLHYVSMAGTSMSAKTECEQCCCRHVDEPYGPGPADGPHEAPWWDPMIDQSEKFLGLYGELSIGPVTENGRVRQRLTFTGLLLSSCAEGRVYGNQWVQDQLTQSCGVCEGFEGTIFTHCGDATFGSLADVEFPNPRPDETIGRECCDGAEPDVEPPVLGLAPATVPAGDTGQRQVIRLRYVQDSYQVVDTTSWLDCFGAHVTFSFDLETPHLHTELFEVCELGVAENDDGDEIDAAIFDECYCRPIEIDTSTPRPECSRCGWPCSCDTTITRSTENTGATSGYTPVEAEACVWSLPLCSTRRTCVTPPLPFTQAVPVISIDAGPTDVDLLVTFWEAHPGLPDPQTCVGYDIYCGREPLAEPVQLHIPAGTAMVLDGRSGVAELVCDGFGPAGSLASTANGTRVSIPSVRCSQRMWIGFDADCYNLPELGTRIRVEMAGRFTA